MESLRADFRGRTKGPRTPPPPPPPFLFSYVLSRFRDKPPFVKSGFSKSF